MQYTAYAPRQVLMIQLTNVTIRKINVYCVLEHKDLKRYPLRITVGGSEGGWKAANAVVIMLRINTHQMYNGQESGDQSQATPSMATKSREAIAPSIFRLGCLIFCYFPLLQGKRHGSRSPNSRRRSAYATEPLWLQIPAYHTTIPSTSTPPQHNAARRTRQGPQPRQEIRCFKHNRCYN